MAEVGLLPNFLPDDLRWKYWQERGDWLGPRSYVMTRGSEILAHGAVIPGAYSWNGQRVRTVHVVDWVARPSAMGAGTSLMKHLGQAGDALLAIGGTAQTLQILPHLGFRIRGSATGYVRPLHPTRVLTPSVHPTWRVTPRLLRSVWWNIRARRGGTEDWHVSRVSAAELPRLGAALPRPTNGMAVLERSSELFRYSLACPIAAMSLFTMERAGRTRGYFLLSLALRQARLADCWMDSADPADWRALIQCAVREAMQYSRAAELAVWASDPLLSRCLRECGFRARNEVPVQLLGPRDPALLPPALRVQMLDNDAAYRHLGRNEFWA
ncbi:MAG TPA: hypothetical protein VGC34_18955 [Steroidobacteraceae bacterium]